MSKTTPASLSLIKAGVAFTLHGYDYDPGSQRIGLQAAEALGLDPGQTFKTLMTEVDKQAVCVVVPSDQEVSMKKLASVAKGKSAQMMAVAEAERLTGYRVGGISPFGQKKRALTFIDETAELYDLIYVNAGQRGLLLSIAPKLAAKVLEASLVDLCA